MAFNLYRSVRKINTAFFVAVESNHEKNRSKEPISVESTAGTTYKFSSMARHTLAGQDLLTIEASRSHSDTPHSVGLLWTSDQPDAKTST
jgi:hypothetical protein